jgi:2-keto-3-deoxy-L-rhamnonate aldolase RhmA
VTEPLSLREQILQGPTLYGVAASSMCPAVVEIIGLCGYDFVWLELEHASTDYGELEHLIRAAELRGLIPQVRAAEWNRTSILRVVEAGAKVVVVPQIHTAEQAAAVVEHAKYPPIGARGYNTGSRGVLYGFSGSSPDEIFARANREVCLLVQIESAQAVENAEAIVTTEGIDGILIGPGDLSATMGINSQWDNDELLSAMDRVFRVAQKHQKVTATVTPTPKMMRRWQALGVNMLTLGGDLGSLRGILMAKLQDAKTGA